MSDYQKMSVDGCATFFKSRKYVKLMHVGSHQIMCMQIPADCS